MRTITKNILSISIGDLLSLTIGFIVTAYLARILGSSGFGQISFALAIFSYSLIIINLGLLTIGIREVAKKRELAFELLNNILGLRLFLALTIFGLVILLTFIVYKFQTIKSLIIIYHLSLFPFAFYLDWFFQGLESMEYIGFAKVINPLIYLILVMFLVRTPDHINLIPIFWFSGVATSTLFLLLVYMTRFGKLKISFRLDLWQGLLRLALPVGLGTICAEIARNFPIVTIGFIKDDISVGNYSAAQKLVYLALIIDRIFFVVLLPAATRYFNENIEKLKDLLKRSARVITMLIIPIAFGCTVLAPRLITLVYGRGYEKSTTVFQILIWFFVLTIFNTIYCCGLIVTNQEKRYGINILLGTILHIVANPIMTLLWGINGTASSVIISEIFTLGLMYWRFRATIHLKIWFYIPKPLLASLAMAFLIIKLTPNSLPLGFLTGLIFYTVVLYVIKGITNKDIKFLFKIFSLE